jgi:bacillithiol system protein YtxJ
MNWQPITTIDQLEQIKSASFTTPQVIFKHSTTCSISRMALDRFERADAPENVDFHYLDLLNYRSISNAIAEFFQVHHESPQVILVKQGECIYDESHYGIMMDELISFL